MGRVDAAANALRAHEADPSRAGAFGFLEKPVERVHNYSMYTKTLFTHHYGWLERRATGWQWQVFDIHDRIIDVLNITDG